MKKELTIDYKFYEQEINDAHRAGYKRAFGHAIDLVKQCGEQFYTKDDRDSIKQNLLDIDDYGSFEERLLDALFDAVLLDKGKK